MAGGLPRIERLYAFVAVDPADGTEGVMSFMGSMGWTPMVCMTESVVDLLRPRAEAVGRTTGAKVTLISFDHRVEIEEVMEGGSNG